MTALRLGIYIADQSRLNTSSQGITNYSIALIQALAGQLVDDTLIVYSNSDLIEELGDADTVEVREVPPPRTRTRRVLYDYLLAEYWARKDKLDLLHYPKGFLSPARIGSHARVATVHDDIPMQYHTGRWQYGSRARWRYFSSGIRRTLKHADHVLTVTKFSRERLTAWSQSWGLTSPPITVTYPSLILGRTHNRATKHPMVLVFGSILPHKRVAEGLEFVLTYLGRTGLAYRVLILGNIGTPQFDFARQHALVDVTSQILGTQELAALISSSAVLVFPSEYEGFGLPPIEAYALGTPAVYALNGATRETLAGIPGGYEQGDYGSFQAALQHALAMDTPTLETFERVVRQRYSAQKMAQETLAAYRRATSHHRRQG